MVEEDDVINFKLPKDSRRIAPTGNLEIPSDLGLSEKDRG